MLTNLLLRVLLLLAGLLFAASLSAVAAAMFLLWGVRAAWSVLTGRPVTPFIVGLPPSGLFGQMMGRVRPQPRPAPARSRTPRADAVSGRLADVSDVEAKPPVR